MAQLSATGPGPRRPHVVVVGPRSLLSIGLTTCLSTVGGMSVTTVSGPADLTEHPAAADAAAVLVCGDEQVFDLTLALVPTPGPPVLSCWSGAGGLTDSSRMWVLDHDASAERVVEQLHRQLSAAVRRPLHGGPPVELLERATLTAVQAGVPQVRLPDGTDMWGEEHLAVSMVARGELIDLSPRGLDAATLTSAVHEAVHDPARARARAAQRTREESIALPTADGVVGTLEAVAGGARAVTGARPVPSAP